ncbi:YaiI/YqxD family protein [Caldovatus sp. SYSU G05006]|uniref:UPF0178 protein K1J50_07195 n=1 Tax=Caldovatus aquaticus TaxID=2865671 RepID=A0ABS7F185_9PROT|nr:YaiI/YqxD family protein [Caldovatus aquaticus]
MAPPPVLYLDGDACPVREEAYRVAARHALPVVLVSNGRRGARPPPLPNARLVVVGEGADAADDWIAEHIAPGDICVTADIPLAARCLAKGARAVAPRGHVWTADNIGGALAGREVARALREAGRETGGPAAMARADRARFLGALDALVRASLRADAGAAPPAAPAAGRGLTYRASSSSTARTCASGASRGRKWPTPGSTRRA